MYNNEYKSQIYWDFFLLYYTNYSYSGKTCLTNLRSSSTVLNSF